MWGVEDALQAPDRATVPVLTSNPDTEAFNNLLLDALDVYGVEAKGGEPGVFRLLRCPWADKHTDGAGGDGAALALIGACDGTGLPISQPWFKCHHGHGMVDHWPQLLELVDPLNTGLRVEYMRLQCAAQFGVVDIEVDAGGTVRIDGEEIAALNPPMTLDEMLDRLLFIASEDAIIDLRRRGGEPMPVKTARNLFASSMDRTVGPRGGITVTQRFATWLAHAGRRTAWAMLWYPGRSSVFQFEHHSEMRAGVPYYNLWVDKPLPAVPTDWSRRVTQIVEHIEYLVPNKVLRETFLDWLAHACQKPDERPHTHFLMISEGGAQGIGRGFLGDLLGATFSGVKRASISDIIDPTFNEVFFESLFVIVDEAEERELKARAAAIRHLKDSTTKKVGVINPKFGRKRTAMLFSRILAFSNSMQSLPIDMKDRRWNVVMNPRMPQPDAYYVALYALLKEPLTLAAFVEYLRRRDISKYNPFSPALMTSTKLEMLEHTTSELVLSLMKVQRHYTPDVVIANELQEALMGVPMSVKQSSVDAQTLRKACDEADVSNYPTDRLKFEGAMVRVRILRNHKRWQVASADEVRSALGVLDKPTRLKYLSDAKNEVSHLTAAPGASEADSW